MKHKNTLQRGSVRFIVFRERNEWYGICLEFNIIEAGDTPQEAMILLFEAVRGYLESAQKIKARPHILNQKPDPEYEEMWERLQTTRVRERALKSVFTYGMMSIPQAAREQAFVPA